MSKDEQIKVWCLGDPATNSPDTLVGAAARLRSRGGFGLTTLPEGNGNGNGPGRCAADLEGAIDNELLLPDPAGSGAGMRLMPPGDFTPAEIKPGKLLDLIQHPPDIDLRDAYDPGTSLLEELDEKRRELQYRKDWLEALLAVTNDELAAFGEARKQRLLKDADGPLSASESGKPK